MEGKWEMIESIHDQRGSHRCLKSVEFKAGLRHVEVSEYDSNLIGVTIRSPNWPKPQVIVLSQVAFFLLREALMSLDGLEYGNHVIHELKPEYFEGEFMVPEDQV